MKSRCIKSATLLIITGSDLGKTASAVGLLSYSENIAVTLSLWDKGIENSRGNITFELIEWFASTCPPQFILSPWGQCRSANPDVTCLITKRPTFKARMPCTAIKTGNFLFYRNKTHRANGGASRFHNGLSINELQFKSDCTVRRKQSSLWMTVHKKRKKKKKR